jgi:hypothetical protein
VRLLCGFVAVLDFYMLDVLLNQTLKPSSDECWQKALHGLVVAACCCCCCCL